MAAKAPYKGAHAPSAEADLAAWEQMEHALRAKGDPKSLKEAGQIKQKVKKLKKQISEDKAVEKQQKKNLQKLNHLMPEDEGYQLQLGKVTDAPGCGLFCGLTPAQYVYQCFDIFGVVHWLAPKFDVGYNAVWEHIFNQLNLEQEALQKFSTVFWTMDRNHNGDVNMIEFLMYFNIERTRFTDRLFSCMDVSGNGQLDFLEFTVAVWNFCALENIDVYRFAFYLYTTKNWEGRDLAGEDVYTDVMDLDAIDRMIEELWGEAWDTNENARKIRSEFRKYYWRLEAVDKELDTEMFIRFLREENCELIMFPTLQLQRRIGMPFGDWKFWQSQIEKRRIPDEEGDLWTAQKVYTLLKDYEFRTQQEKFRLMKEAKEMKKFFQAQPDQEAEAFKTQAVVKRLELECAVCLELDGEPRNICIECANSYHVDCMDDPQFRFDEESKSPDSPAPLSESATTAKSNVSGGANARVHPGASNNAVVGEGGSEDEDSIGSEDSGKSFLSFGYFRQRTQKNFNVEDLGTPQEAGPQKPRVLPDQENWCCPHCQRKREQEANAWRGRAKVKTVHGETVLQLKDGSVRKLSEQGNLLGRPAPPGDPPPPKADDQPQASSSKGKSFPLKYTRDRKKRAKPKPPPPNPKQIESAPTQDAQEADEQADDQQSSKRQWTDSNSSQHSSELPTEHGNAALTQVTSTSRAPGGLQVLPSVEENTHKDDESDSQSPSRSESQSQVSLERPPMLGAPLRDNSGLPPNRTLPALSSPSQRRKLPPIQHQPTST